MALAAHTVTVTGAANGPSCRRRLSARAPSAPSLHSLGQGRHRPVAPRPRTLQCRADMSGMAQFVSNAASSPEPGLVAGALINSSVFLIGLPVLRKGLSPAGILHSWLLGTLTFAAFGSGSYALLCLYFVVGTAVTKLKLKLKQQEGTAEAHSGRRGAASVWGSGAACAACACAALSGLGGTDWLSLWRLGAAASVVSKLADTVSSEVGKAYGKQAYLSTTFAPVPRGTEGAVSAEGSAAGLVAALAMTGLACALGQTGPRVSHAAAVAAAAVAANWAESVAGAAVQGRVTWLSNDVINGLQVGLAAGLAMAMAAAAP